MYSHISETNLTQKGKPRLEMQAMTISRPTEARRKCGYGRNRKTVVLHDSLLTGRARSVYGLSWTVDRSLGTQVFLLMVEMLLKRGNTLPGSLLNFMICQLTVWCREREKGRTFRYSRVLARRLNYLEAQMVFSSILLPNSWDLGRPREILDMNNCPHRR